MRQAALLFLLLFFSTASLAQEAPVTPQEEAIAEMEQCGMDEEKVIPLDGTLCRDDIAFGMMYDFFPSVYNTLIPLWDLSMFSSLASSPSTPETVGHYNGDDVMIVLYDMIYEILLWAGLILLGLLALNFLLRALRGDSVFADDGENESKDSAQTLASGIGTGAIFLISIKNFTVGMLVVFSLSAFALTIANSVSSFFLSTMQTMYEQNQRDAEVPALPGDVVDRHSFAADHFYRSLTRMQLCRMQSTSYALTDVGSGYMTSQDYQQGVSCQYGENRVADKLYKDEGESPAFIGRYSSPVNTTVWHHFTADELIFGTTPKMLEQCRMEPVSLPEYECGSFEIKHITWADNPLVQLLDSPAPLVQVLSDIGASLSATSAPDEIRGVLAQQWGVLKAEVDDAYESLDSRFSQKETENVILDNRVVSKKSAFERVQDESRRPHYEDLIRKLSQFAMNAVMFGQHERFVRENQTYTVPANFRSIEVHSDVAESLARIVREGQCRDYPKNLVNASAATKFMTGEASVYPAEGIARCIDFPNANVLGYPSPWAGMDADESHVAAQQEFDNQVAEFQVAWEAAVTALTAQRWAVEEGFFELINGLSPDDWWKRMRQRGYLAAPDYIQKAVSKSQRNKDNLTALIDNFDAGPMRFNSYYMDENLVNDRDVEDLFNDYQLAGSQILDSTNLTMDRLDPLLDRADWVSSKRQYLRQGTLPLTTTWMDELLGILPSSQHVLARLGVSTDPEAKNRELCIEDAGKCPFILTDPLVEISLIGHDILDMGITLYLMALPVKGINEIRAMTSRTGKGVMGAESRFYKAIGKSAGYLSFAGKAIAKQLELFDFIFDKLSPLMFFFIIIGAAMAYLLPFLPKLFMYFNFVTWVTIVVMASFGVLVWALYLMRMRENKEQLRSAGLHFSVQIMLRPTFNLIGVIFSILFFYVVAVVIGLSAWWIDAMPAGSAFFDSNILRYFTDAIIVISMFAFIYYVGIKLVLEMINELESSMLTKFGVKTGPNSSSLNNVIKAIVFDRMRIMAQRMNAFSDSRGTTRGQQKAAQEMQGYAAQLNQQMAAAEEMAKKSGDAGKKGK